MKAYNLYKSVNGVNGFGAPICDTRVSTTLALNTEATTTVPGTNNMGSASSNQYLAVFSYEPAKKVWVAFNETAAVPAGATLVATTSVLNPTARVVKSGDVIHIISAAAADVGIEFYELGA